MIKIESVHIEELRGIRKLDLAVDRETLAIYGPNGSGKSGVIDAIEFGLTGEIGRLSGRGTKGLSISEHGPHVDRVKFPDAALVSLRVFLPTLGKSATITRKVSSPKKPTIVPADSDIKAALAEVAEHPELTLSRREILRFIVSEPTKRSEEIQAILRLDEIGQMRSALNSAHNKLRAAEKTATALVESSRQALQQHLQISTMRRDDVLAAANARRKALNLRELADLTADTKLDVDLLADGAKPLGFDKPAALREIQAFTQMAEGFPAFGSDDAATIVAALNDLGADTALRAALRRRSFIQRGLEFVDEERCPFCDTSWGTATELRQHIEAKVLKLKELGDLEERILTHGRRLAAEVTKVVAVLTRLNRVAFQQEDVGLSGRLSVWKADLEGLCNQLGTLEGIEAVTGRLSGNLLNQPSDLIGQVAALKARIEELPDQSEALTAQTFLSTAQLRLGDYREAMRRAEAAVAAAKSAQFAYEAYCRVLEDELNTLYDEVQQDFSAYYREINDSDEATFTAKLTPTEGSLALDVNFYERGLFPPSAYHSEGHQDGMGVCLYLALMKRLFGPRFALALLDDVVMSVDTDHRHQFCKLLKNKFPDTQFIITTHDRVWAEQMKSAKLVASKRLVAFQGWTVDAGPVIESPVEIWADIEAALAKGKIDTAASTLRRHLEYVARLLADQLGATTPFRADGNYELGDLLPSVLRRFKDLLGEVANAAQSWNDNETKRAVGERKAALAACNGAADVERWAVNKAVHHNPWANFSKADFAPVVAAYRELLARFRCSSCDSWLYVEPRLAPATLRCPCNKTSLNLAPKPRRSNT